MAQLTGCRPMHRKVASWVPHQSQSTFPGRGRMGGRSMFCFYIDVFVFFLSFTSPSPILLSKNQCLKNLWEILDSWCLQESLIAHILSCLYMPFRCPSSYTCLYVSFSIGSRSYAIAWNVSSCRTVDTGSKPRSIIMSWEWVLPWNNKINYLKKLPPLCGNTFLLS